jgi:DNA-binding NarL/FixJ family response regulator
MRLPTETVASGLRPGQQNGGRGTSSVSVLLCDHDQIRCTGLRRILNEEPGIDVVGESSDAFAGLDMTIRTRPDVVLVDVDLPKAGGIEAVQRLKSGGSPSSHAILLATHELDLVIPALLAGASGSYSRRGGRTS